MNKRIITVVLFVVLALCGVLYFFAERSVSSLLKRNVEVLADNVPSFGPMCSKTLTPGTFMMKNCNNCNGSYGKYAMDDVAFCVHY